MSTETTIVLDRIQEMQDKIFQGAQDLQGRIVEMNTKAAAELNDRSPRLATAAGKASDASAEFQAKFNEFSDKGRTEAKERFDSIADQIEETFSKVRDRFPEGREINIPAMSSVDFPSARELFDNSRDVAERSIEMNRSFAKNVAAAWAPSTKAPARAAKKSAAKKATATKASAKVAVKKSVKTTAKKAASTKAAATKSA